MKNFISEKFIIWIIIISVVLLLLTIGIFAYNFWGTEYSSDINDWGAFGGYFGGVISVIFSVSSFVILAYITIAITKQSYILPKKWEAYENLLKHVEGIKVFTSKVDILVEELHLISKDIAGSRKNISMVKGEPSNKER